MDNKKNYKFKVFNKDFVILELIVFLLFTTFNLTMPLMSSAAERIGATGALMGLAASLFAFVSLLTRPITGPMADIFNRKRQFQFVLIMYTICYLGYAISRNVAVMLLFRALHGFSLGVLSTVAATLSAEYLPKEKVSFGMGVYMVIQSLSSAVGPFIGLWMTKKYNFTFCFIFSSIIIALCLLVSPLLKDSDKGIRHGNFSFLTGKFNIYNFIHKECLIPAIIISLLAMGFSCVSSFISQLAEYNGVSNVGVFFIIYALCVTLFRPIVNKICEKFGEEKIILPCCLLFAVSLALGGVAKSMAQYWIMAILMAMGYGSAFVVLLIIANNRVTSNKRGVASSTYFCGIDIGYSLGPVMGGAVAGKFGYNIMMFVMVIPVLIAIAVSATKRKKLKSLELE